MSRIERAFTVHVPSSENWGKVALKRQIPLVGVPDTGVNGFNTVDTICAPDGLLKLMPRKRLRLVVSATNDTPDKLSES